MASREGEGGGKEGVTAYVSSHCETTLSSTLTSELPLLFGTGQDSSTSVGAEQAAPMQSDFGHRELHRGFRTELKLHSDPSPEILLVS
jgi:hypothetical protein